MKKLTLVNAADVRRIWEHWFIHGRAGQEGRPNLVLLRHAHKMKGGGSRCGLSPLGEDATRLYRDAMCHILQEQAFTFLAARTGRNLQTLAGLTLDLHSIVIECPAQLDLPYLGPDDCDLMAAARLAEQNGGTANDFIARLEEFNIKRLGEPRTDGMKRIFRGLADAVMTQHHSTVIYCGNSPIMNDSIGVGGVLPELGTLFVRLVDEKAEVLERIDPIFKEVEE